MSRMIREDYSQQIDEFERVLQSVATDIAGRAVFERLPPKELWSKAEGHVTTLKNLSEAFRETMLTLKPEKTPVIEQRLEAFSQPLNAFKEILFQETAQVAANSRLALEQLRKAVAGGSDLLVLAKEIRDSPSQAIEAILKLREVYDAKEYLAAVRAPATFRTRLTKLTRHMETLEAAMKNLEKALDEVKERLSVVQEESRKFHSEPEEAPAEESEEGSEAETGGT